MKDPEDLSVDLSRDAVVVCLIGAVIKQAIVDYFNPQLSGSGYRLSKYREATNRRKKRMHDDAKKFLFRDINEYLQLFGLTINVVYLHKLVHQCYSRKYRTNLLSPHANKLMENLWI